jgi:hypothetical protein
VSKPIPGGGGFFGGKRFVGGGRAGRTPGRGFGRATLWPSNNKPVKGFGSKNLRGRPPKGKGPYGGGLGRGPKGDE